MKQAPSATYNNLLGPSINDDSWHHIAVTYNVTNMTLYSDGVQVNETAISGDIHWDGGNTLIGNRRPSGTCGITPFNGTLDEVSVWTRQLNASEISSLYNSGSGRLLIE